MTTAPLTSIDRRVVQRDCGSPVAVLLLPVTAISTGTASRAAAMAPIATSRTIIVNLSERERRRSSSGAMMSVRKAYRKGDIAARAAEASLIRRYMENGSLSRIRTYGRSINSRELYR